MPAILSLVFSKGGMIAMGVIAALIAGGLWLHHHDNAVRAAMQTSADKAIAAQQAVDAEHEKVAIAAVASDAQKRAVVFTSIKDKTHAAPVTSACANSPAVAALLNGLRNANSAGTKATGGPVPAHVPGPAKPTH